MYVGPVQTGFLRGVPKKFLRNRNHDSCEKSATGEENTGILRVPTGITNLVPVFPCVAGVRGQVITPKYVKGHVQVRPPSACRRRAAVAAGKNISKLSRHALSSRRAVDRAKLLTNFAGNRAGRPTSLVAAPSTPSMPTSPPTRSERYALRSAEKSIDKTLAEHSSPNRAERDPLAESASFVPGDVSEGDDCSSGGDQRM